jgi:hypothetical protein
MNMSIHLGATYVANGFEAITLSSLYGILWNWVNVSTNVIRPFSQGLSFLSTAVYGTTCGLPTVEKVSDLAEMRRYAIAQAETWYYHTIVRRGRIALNGSLYLITGTERTDSCGTATVLQLYHGSSCIHLVPNPGGSHYWVHSPSSARTETNRRDAINDTNCRNQAVFVKWFKLGLGVAHGQR